MAKKKSQRSESLAETPPKFPYTTAPSSLRTFLKCIPNKPRPAKVNGALLKSWGLTDSNAASIPRVLKALDLLASTGEPTGTYTAFMQPASGPAVLGNQIRKVYSELFGASHQPYRDADDELKRLFHIHSGGAEQTIRLQIQTFKAQCDFASFDSIPAIPAAPGVGSAALTPPVGVPPTSSAFTLHVDLHLHLPENKSARDYQAIIEDIARFIYGRETTGDD